MTEALDLTALKITRRAYIFRELCFPVPPLSHVYDHGFANLSKQKQNTPPTWNDGGQRVEIKVTGPSLAQQRPGSSIYVASVSFERRTGGDWSELPVATERAALRRAR